MGFGKEDLLANATETQRKFHETFEVFGDVVEKAYALGSENHPDLKNKLPKERMFHLHSMRYIKQASQLAVKGVSELVLLDEEFVGDAAMTMAIHMAVLMIATVGTAGAAEGKERALLEEVWENMQSDKLTNLAIGHMRNIKTVAHLMAEEAKNDGGFGAIVCGSQADDELVAKTIAELTTQHPNVKVNYEEDAMGAGNLNLKGKEKDVENFRRAFNEAIARSSTIERIDMGR